MSPSPSPNISCPVFLLPVWTHSCSHSIQSKVLKLQNGLHLSPAETATVMSHWSKVQTPYHGLAPPPCPAVFFSSQPLSGQIHACIMSVPWSHQPLSPLADTLATFPSPGQLPFCLRLNATFREPSIPNCFPLSFCYSTEFFLSSQHHHNL